MATKELISAATVNRVISREGKVLGYQVKSNSSDQYYQVTGSKVNGKCTYFCTCKAGQNGFKNCKDGACCHVKAVKEVVAARREIAQQQGNTAPAMGCLGEQEQAEQVEKLDGNDALVSTTAVELLANETAKAAAHRAIEVELKAAVFVALQKQYDYRSAAPVAPVPAQPIATRGTLNNRNRGFSLLR